MNSAATDQPYEPGWYELRLEGRLDPHWSAWLDGMDITSATDGTTVLSGRVVDQSALHGLLARLRDIGLPLISVARVEPDSAQSPTPHDNPTGD
jgi:hypothetical protein